MSRRFLNWFAVAGLLVSPLAGCADTPELQAERERRRSPASIRGFIWDIEAPAPGTSGTLSVVDPAQAESQRKQRIFAQTNIHLENVTSASGGLLDSGSFIILDVPPRSVTLRIQTPVLGDFSIPMANIPPNADVFLPGIIIGNEGVRFAEPGKIRVRVPGPARRNTGEMATIGPHQVPIEEVPVSDLADRRVYPTPEPPAQAAQQSATPAAATETSGAAATPVTTAQ